MNEVSWEFSEALIEATATKPFQDHINTRHSANLTSRADFQSWSSSNAYTYWQELVAFSGLKACNDRSFAQNILEIHANSSEDALVLHNERGTSATTRISGQKLQTQAAQLSAWMQKQGVESNDVVAAYVPNTPQSIVPLLATSALSAAWITCSPDSGFNDALNHLKHQKPKLLFAADAYFNNGAVQDTLNVVDQLAATIDEIEQVIVMDYVFDAEDRSSTLPGGRPVVALAGILANAQ